MALTEQQFIELEGNINETYDAYFHDVRDFIPEMFKVVKKNQSQFTDYTTGAMGRMTPWAGSVAYDSFEKGYTKQYKAEKYSTGIQIDRDLYEDKEYEAIASRVNKAAESVVTTLQYDSVQVFENAFSTTILGPDGKALCASDHKTTPSADAQSNSGTNELTYDGVEASNLAMESLTNDRGDKMLLMGDMVIAGPRQRDNCKKLFGSEKEAFVGDNTKNIYKDMSFFIHPLLTGDKWFLVNRKVMKGGSGLNWFMRRDPRKLERDGSTAAGDFNTEILSWKAVGRYDYGWTNFYWCYGNNI